ncbi:TRAP transporter substrate-binding protein [Synergistaceae bacterium OttesenSCG-928-I11]|nr:TRAP transporter substrate-binding protein [Synergistaceae bacterium OttesenSCG-928-I11]
MEKRIYQLAVALFCTSMVLVATFCLNGCTQSAFASEKKVVFTYNMSFGAPGSPEEQSAIDLIEGVEKLSGGRITSDRIANGVMGGEREVAEAIQMGTLDCAILSDVGIDVVTGNLGWAWLPFMITSYEDADRYYHQGWVYDDMTTKMAEAGIVRLASAETGIKALGNVKREIKTAEDLKGLKIRTTETPDLIRFYELLGCLPVAMSASETVPALEQKTIDGVDTTFYNFRVQGVLDMLTYICKTGHQYTGTSIIVSEKFWASLSNEDKEIFRKAAKQAGENNKTNKRAAERALEEECRASGKFVINELNDETRAKFRSAADTLWDEYKNIYDPVQMEKVINQFGKK